MWLRSWLAPRRSTVRTVLLALVLSAPLTGAALAKCGDDSADAQAVAEARAQIEGDCNCVGATTHGAYVRCALGVVKARVAAGTLPASCKREVRRCAARSTCGKPGFVTCCLGGPEPHCRTMKDEATCTGKSGTGGACRSCCDACGAGGCVQPTTTTSSTSTTTTTTIPCADASPSYPICAGGCGEAEVCQAIGHPGGVGECLCVPADTSCDTVAYQCVLGTCAPGEVCKVQVGNDCACLPAGY